MSIGEDFRDWQYTDGGNKLIPGIAHASSHVSGCFESQPPLNFRSEDDNAKRQAQIMAIYDWCWGDDVQWLVSQSEEHRYYSHDHGFYFPPGGQHWGVAELTTSVDVPHELTDTHAGFKREHLDDIANRLDNLTRADLVEAVAAIPTSWPATDDELESLGYFLERRASQVAARVRVYTGERP